MPKPPKGECASRAPIPFEHNPFNYFYSYFHDPAIWGAWADSLKPIPSLLRDATRSGTSPRRL